MRGVDETGAAPAECCRHRNEVVGQKMLLAQSRHQHHARRSHAFAPRPATSLSRM